MWLLESESDVYVYIESESCRCCFVSHITLCLWLTVFFVFPSLFCEMCVCFWGGSITAWQLSQVEFWQKLALSKHSAGRRRDEEDFTFVKKNWTWTTFEDLVYLWQGMGLCRRSPFELGRLHSGSPEGEGRGFGGRAVENLFLNWLKVIMAMVRKWKWW